MISQTEKNTTALRAVSTSEEISTEKISGMVVVSH